MSRVERTEEHPSARRSDQLQQAQHGRRDSDRDPSPGHTPSKAEGEVEDIEEALRHERE